jgi:putative hydrolase of HD superfamily
VITKSPPPIDLLDGKDAPPFIQFYFQINQLKSLYRQGWLQRGLPAERVESVAEHVFSMALLGLILCRERFPELDAGRVVCMTLIHELGEIYTGDLTPQDGVSEAEKHHRERASLEAVLANLTDGTEFRSLWLEFEAGQTPEARFVRQLDRLEMGLQALVYHLEGHPAAGALIASARKAQADPRMLELMAEAQALV